MTKFKDFLEEQLKNPEVKKEYDALENEYVIRRAQTAFAGVAEALGISSKNDVQAIVDEVRYKKD